MARFFLDTNLKTTDPKEALPVIEGLFHQIEDQSQVATDLISLTDDHKNLPEGIRSGDVVVSLLRGELKVGIYNGINVVYASFGSFTDTITDTQHGPRAGGNLHELASSTLAGFMSAPDKLKLDSYKGDTSSAGAASTTEYPLNGDWGFHNNTTAGTLVLAKNFSGTIKSVALT